MAQQFSRIKSPLEKKTVSILKTNPPPLLKGLLDEIIPMRKTGMNWLYKR